MQDTSLTISIITVCYNSVKTIESAVRSVISQDYPRVEYIVVDGGSTDGTLQAIEAYKDHISTLISEPDQGIYDAMNKGVRAAKGDVVGILNADDVFHDAGVLSKVAAGFRKSDIEAVVGDIVFVKGDKGEKVLRRYSAKNWNPGKFSWGYMPPHPSFFAKKYLFEKYGYYKTDYHIAADYELLIRFLYLNKVKWKYLPITTTKMRMGGRSTSGLKSLFTLNREIARGCRENGLYSNYLMIYSKYLFKPFEFILK